MRGRRYEQKLAAELHTVHVQLLLARRILCPAIALQPCGAPAESMPHASRRAQSGDGVHRICTKQAPYNRIITAQLSSHEQATVIKRIIIVDRCPSYHGTSVPRTCTTPYWAALQYCVKLYSALFHGAGVNRIDLLFTTSRARGHEIGRGGGGMLMGKFCVN